MRRQLITLPLPVLLAAACGRSDDAAPRPSAAPELVKQIAFCGQALPADTASVKCTDPAIIDLTELTGFRSLHRISLAGTKIRSLSQLRDVGKVTHLDLTGTALTDLSSFDAMQWTSLEFLSLSDTEISDLAPLSTLPKLKTLQLDGTKVTDLRPVMSIATLTDLNAADSAINQLPALTGASALEKLDVTSTLVSDLTPLRGATHLKHLRVGHTLVQDVSTLADLPALATLDASYTALTLSSLEALRRQRPDVEIESAPQWTGSLDELRTLISKGAGAR